MRAEVKFSTAVLTCLLLIGCGGSNQTAGTSSQDDTMAGRSELEAAGSNDVSVPTAKEISVALGSGGGDIEPNAEYLTDLLPNLRQRLSDKEEVSQFQRSEGLSERLLRVRVLSISKGRGVVETYEGDGNVTGSPSQYQGPKEVDFDDDQAWWRTLKVQVEIIDPLGPAIGTEFGDPSAKDLELEIAYYGSPDIGDAAETLTSIDDGLVLVGVGKSDRVAQIQQIVPINADGTFAVDPDEYLTPRFDTIDEFTMFAYGPGETVTLDPSTPGFNVVARESR